MAVIGTFTRDKEGYTGTIETLTCAPAPVRVVAIAKPSATAPDYRLYRGVAEVGAAWLKTARNGRAYLAVTLDDPAFARPVQARLVASGARFALLWSRD